MKNKKLRYILLPAVLLIWGLVIYKFFSYSGDSPNYNIDLTSKIDTSESIIAIDTFSLIADYRDPFLGRQSSFRTYIPSYSAEDDYDAGPNSANTNNYNNKPKENNKPPERQIKWPQVKYSGLITNSQTYKKVGIMQINGRKLLIEENTSYENLQILMLSEDSVRTSYFNNFKTFYK